jgi:hypothetical protein
VFGECDPYEEQIKILLQEYCIEDLLEVLDITEYAVISLLLNEGYCVLPPWLQQEEIEEEISE